VPTQIRAEAFKLHGFDGIAYKSSYGEDGFSVTLFDIEAAALINCGLYRIRDVPIVMAAQDNPYFVSKHYTEAANPEAIKPPGNTPAALPDDTVEARQW